MKYSLTGEQRFYFEKTGFIIFEEFLKESLLPPLYQAAMAVALKRAEPSTMSKGAKTSKTSLTPQQALLQGRDLFCEEAKIRKLAAKRGVVTFIAELTGQKAIRLAFDQLIVTSDAPLPDRFLHPLLSTYLQGPLLIADNSSIQGLLFYSVICLENEAPQPLSEAEKESSSFSLGALKPGEVAFLSPTLSFPFHELYGQRKGTYILTGYSTQQALYVHQEKDLHNHFLKKSGYVFGDRLKDPRHPLLLKRF